MMMMVVMMMIIGIIIIIIINNFLALPKEATTDQAVHASCPYRERQK